MDRLLYTKAETNGKNTSYFPGRNIQAGTMIRDGRVLAVFTICEEEEVEYEGVTVSWFDLQHALKGDPLLLSKVWAG